MPIKIPNELPAVKTLTEENIFVMTETRAITQDIRPLKIVLLNLMPTKIDTETQFSRLLGNTPLQIELELIHTKTHKSKNISEEHMLAFYKTFDDIKDQNFDGMIITGAPVEQMEFEDVTYWDELCEIIISELKNILLVKSFLEFSLTQLSASLQFFSEVLTTCLWCLIQGTQQLSLRIFLKSLA